MPKTFVSIEEKREYQRNIQARWRERNPEKVEAAKPAAAERTARWRDANRERNRINMQRWREEFKQRDPEGYREFCRLRGIKYRSLLRIRVVKAYGGFCTCCGIIESYFLTFDHMDGGGRVHRKANNLNGAAFYLWLWNNGELQKRIRLLCFNCNCAIGFRGYCPHQRDNIPTVSG